VTFFILRRVGMGAVLVFLVLTLIFSAIRLIPGDPVELLLSSGNTTASPETVERMRAQLGLNGSLPAQYWNFLTGVLTGDLGHSIRTDDAVAQSIAQRLPRTLELVTFATVISMLVGIPLGAWAAARGGFVDSAATILTSLGVALPVYVIGTLLIFVFSLTLGWLPAGGFTTWQQNPGRHFQLLVLPAIALSLGFTAIIARMTRSAVLETMDQDWVRTATAFGHTPLKVFRRHVMRNSMTPVTTVIGLGFGTLLGSTVLAERVFNYPGLSSLLVESVSNRDYAVVQGIVIIIALLFILINIVVDIVYGLLDPRVRQ
jgi:peptide/nickel transport system permease protein